MVLPTQKILFIVHHRLNRSPGQRFRFEMFLDDLSNRNVQFVISNLISEKDDAVFYGKGKLLGKLWVVVKAFFIRVYDVFRAKNYESIYIYREAFFFHGVFFERLFSLLCKKVIFDFDDAIWLPEVSEGNKAFAFLKNPNKTKKIISLSNKVIVGNNYLKEYALQFNKEVFVIPTVVDTSYHCPKSTKPTSTKVCIGWTGTSSTLKHLLKIETVLQTVQASFGDKVFFKIIADKTPNISGIDLIFKKWCPQSEIEDLQDFDIGIMPLPNDPWSKGKCGFKAIQCMALGIATIVSPVGMNTDLIQDRLNGFWADSDEEWIRILSELIENASLREKTGAAGQETVIEHYSKQAWSASFCDLLLQ